MKPFCARIGGNDPGSLLRSRFLWLIVFSLCMIPTMVLSNRLPLQIGDVLQVFNYGYADLSQTVRIGPDGMVEIKLIGPVQAAGHTPEELARMIQKEYAQFAPESHITVIREEFYPQLAHVMGEVHRNGPIDLTFLRSMSIMQAISASGGFTELADVGKLFLVQPDQYRIEVDLTPVLEQGLDIPLPRVNPGDILIVPRKYERRVYVLGTAGKSGPIYFEDREPFTLSHLISKAALNPENVHPEVRLFREDQQYTLSIEALPSSGDLPLHINDILVINRMEERYVYAVGVGEASGRVEFGFEEKMTIGSLLGKLGLTSLNLPELILWLPGGDKQSIRPQQSPLNQPLIAGTIVEFPAPRYLYVLGDLPTTGKVVFAQEETLTLRTLMAKLGMPLQLPGTVRVTTESGRVYEYSIEDHSRQDIYLQSGSIIEFPYMRYVYVIGDHAPSSGSDGDFVASSGRLIFRWDESMDLKTALTKINAVSSVDRIHVEVIRGSDVYTFDSQRVFMSSVAFDLQRGDIVYTQKDRLNHIYVIQNDQTTSKVSFSSYEPMTLFHLLMKLGEISPTLDSRIRIISPNGVVRMANLDEILAKQFDLSLDPLSVVMLPKTDQRVYVLGNAQRWGEVAFSRDEPFTLRHLLIKVRADLSPATEGIWVYDDGKTEIYSIEEIVDSGRNVPLKTDQIIYIKPFIQPKVNVFGRVTSPGVKLFEKGIPTTLLMVLSKSGGFLDDADRTIKVISSDGVITHYAYDDIEDPSQIIVPDNSYVIVDQNLEQTVIVLGDVMNPGVRSLRRESIALVELLGLAGGVRDWTLNTTIEITRKDGRKEQVYFDEDPGVLSNVQIQMGDVVYVVPSSKLKVYVFGEVVRPGIVRYHSALTLLEAVISSGGPTEAAYMSKVLHFPGGISQNPTMVDLDVIRMGRTSADVFLQPGDVVYVPRSAMVDILQVVTFIGRMISLVDSGVSLYNKIQ